MNKKITAIIGIVVLLIIVLISSKFFTKTSHTDTSAAAVTAILTSQTLPPATSATSSISQSTIVTLTNSGYSPATVTITEGESVTFINKSDSKMWTASGPHPVHTDYPGFDEKSAANNGESYTFTFTKAGDWSYHNHLNPSQSGTIVVKGEN